MTSDLPRDPFLRQLEAFSDQVFQGAPSSPGELDPATQRAVRRLHGIDRIPPFDQRRMTQHKEQLMNVSVPWQLATDPVHPVIPAANGSSPPAAPMPPRPAPLRPPSRTIPLVSAALLLALIGGLIFGIVQYRGSESEPTVPAFVQGTPIPEESPTLGADWSQYRGGIERTGYTSDPGPGASANLLWSLTAEEWFNTVVESDGKVFAYGDKGGLYAIDALTGNQIWAVGLDEQVSDPLMVAGVGVGNGSVYVSTSTGTIVAVDEDSGRVHWEQQLGSPTLWTPTYADGHVYVTVDDARLVALDAETGDVQWSWDFPGGATQQYPTNAGDNLFIADQAFGFYAIDLATGATVWSSQDLEAVRVAAYRDGTLFVPGVDGRVTAVDAATGSIRWVNTDGSSAVLAPVVTDDALIVVNQLEMVRALDLENGEEIWSTPATGVSNPPHASGDTLYLKTMPGVFATFDLATGERIGRIEGAYGAGVAHAISGNMLIVSGVAGPIRAFVPYPVVPTEVQVGIPDSAALLDDPGETRIAVPRGTHA